MASLAEIKKAGQREAARHHASNAKGAANGLGAVGADIEKLGFGLYEKIEKRNYKAVLHDLLHVRDRLRSAQNALTELEADLQLLTASEE